MSSRPQTATVFALGQIEDRLKSLAEILGVLELLICPVGISNRHGSIQIIIVGCNRVAI